MRQFVAFFFLTIIVLVSFASEKNFTFTKAEQQWIREHPIVYVGGEKDWAPFNFVDENGKFNGFGKDYIDLIASYAGFDVEYVVGENWSQLLKNIKNGKIDMLPAINIIQDRKDYIEFTNPYLKLSEYYFTLNKYENLYSLEQLKGKKIGGVKGYAINSWIKENYPEIIVVEKDTILECLESLKTKEIDVFIGDNPSTIYNIEKNFIIGIRLNNVVKERKPVDIYIGVKKEYKILASIINKTLAKLPKEEISKIKSRWMQTVEKKELFLTPNEKEWLENNPIVKVGAMTYWPSDENGHNLHTEILKLINRYSGLHLIPVKFDIWKKGYQRAEKGDKLYGIMGLSWSKEREKAFLYTPAYDYTPSYLVTKKSNKDIQSLKDLKNKIVYIKSNSIIKNMINDTLPLQKLSQLQTQMRYIKNFLYPLKQMQC